MLYKRQAMLIRNGGFISLQGLMHSSLEAATASSNWPPGILWHRLDLWQFPALMTQPHGTKQYIPVVWSCGMWRLVVYDDDKGGKFSCSVGTVSYCVAFHFNKTLFIDTAVKPPLYLIWSSNLHMTTDGVIMVCLYTFLGAFAKLRNVTVLVSSCLSVRL